ncbi:hypothetical protein BBP40_004749 [Aspergillus hancockii]|nr:hypothetical protein BBP40_004749 [Aspergillus hancockii]
MVRPQDRTYDQKTINDSRTQRATTGSPSRRFCTPVPPTQSTSVPCVGVSRLDYPRKSLASTDNRSRPPTRLSNPVSALVSCFETGIYREDGVNGTYSSTSGSIPGPVSGLPSGKERVENHTIPKRKLPAPHQSVEGHPPEILKEVYLTQKDSSQMGYITKGLRWTNGFEDLKTEIRENSTTLSPPNRSKPLDQNATLLGLLPNTGSVRLRNQTERTVLPRNHSTGTHSRLKKPGLTAHTDWVSQISGSQPQQYWLGRFVTLVNAFHYEDSFSGPDIATGFGMLSSYSRPLGSSDSGEEGYRIKRAFMVLENVCMNDDASVSLRKFRNEYIGKFGDWWMK